jgi:hypothetical protein
MIIASATTTVLAAAISAAAGLLGVYVGSVEASRRERRAREEAAKRALDVAALRCLARAHKIRAAPESADEIHHLGVDLDSYVSAIAGVDDPVVRARHWEIYARTGPILMHRQTGDLEAVISALEGIRDELMEDARSQDAAGSYES